MRALLILVTLLAAPAFARELPGTQASRLTLAAIDPSIAPLPSPAPWVDPALTAIQLKLLTNQIQLLEFTRQPLGGALFTTIFGGLGLLVGLVMMPFGYPLILVGLMIGGFATLPFAIGLVWLLGNLAHNQRLDTALEKLRSEQRALSAANPVSAVTSTVEPQLQLAAF